MYFSFFGTILYDSQYLTDLSKVITSQEVDDPRFMYDTYYVQNGERPDSVSNKFYDVPYYHWIILVTNGLTLKTWPKSDQVQTKEWKARFGDIPKGTSHYETDEGIIVPYEFPREIVVDGEPNATYHFNGDGKGVVANGNVYHLGNPVSTYDHEMSINDSRKAIRILDRRFIPDMVNLAKGLLAP